MSPQCAATIVILCIGETHNLINYVSFINYLSYGVTIAGLLYHRWTKPGLYRPIKVALVVTRCHFCYSLQCFPLTFPTCPPGEPAGARVLLDVLGSAAGLQSLLGARCLWRGPGHHAHRRPRLLPGRPLEGKTKVHLPLHWWVAAWVGGRAQGSRLTLFVVFPAERATLLGQSLCFVVFPQLDPVEAAAPSEWTEPSSGRSSLCANS